MLENLFLTYANHSLKENPENLHKIFEEIIPCVDKEKDSWGEYVRILIETIVMFAKFNDPKMSAEYRNEHWLYDIAFEAVYRYRNGYCEKQCYKECYKDVDIDLIGEKRLKCYECHQLAYINHLSKFAEGKKLKDSIVYFIVDKETYKQASKSLKEHGRLPFIKVGDKFRVSGGILESWYLIPAYDCVKTEVRITDDGELEKSHFISFDNLISETSRYELKTRLFKFLNSVVGYSLTEFLFHNDARKIKRCQYCKKFFIAKDIKRKNHCYSSDCEKAYQRDKKRMQRDKDPVRYYTKNKSVP